MARKKSSKKVPAGKKVAKKKVAKKVAAKAAPAAAEAPAPVLQRVCEFCNHTFDDACGRFGCPNCNGEGLGEVIGVCSVIPGSGQIRVHSIDPNKTYMPGASPVDAVERLQAEGYTCFRVVDGPLGVVFVPCDHSE